jgi:hypothetical protein
LGAVAVVITSPILFAKSNIPTLVNNGNIVLQDTDALLVKDLCTTTARLKSIVKNPFAILT